MASDQLARQATCEDYDSDESNGRVLESFRRSSPPSNANATANRPQPADLGAQRAPAQQQQQQQQQQPQQQRMPVNIDLQSDSGYSSHTAATMSSADSAPSFSSSTRSPPMPIPAPMPPTVAAPLPSQSPAQTTQRPRRPTIGEPRPSSTQNAARPKPPGRRESQSSKQRPAIVQRRPTITQESRPKSKPSRENDDGECNDPNCTTCGPNALPVQRRRPEPPPSDSALDVSYPYDPRKRSDAPTSSYASPPSPTYTRQPQYAQGAVITQPGQTRRRASSTAHQRPATYHGDGPTHWTPGMPAPYPSPPQEHGPPLSMSAYRNMPQYSHMPSFMPPSSQSPNGFYTPAQSIHQTSPPYDVQRPSLSARTSSSYSRNNYTPPVVTQERSERMYSARYSQPASATQTMFPPSSLPLGEGDSESESDSEGEYMPDPYETRTLMPPPKITSSSKRRPSMRKAKTTQVVDRIDRPERLERPERPERRMSQSINNLPDRSAPRDRDRERERPSRTTRGASISRPGLVQQRQTQSAYETPQARVIVENPKTSRRQSYQDRDISQEQYAKAQEMQYIAEQKRNSKVYREEHRDSVELNEQKRRNRPSKAYQDDRYELEEDKTEQKRKNRSSRVIHQELYDSDSDEEAAGQELAIVPLSTRRRRDTDAEPRRGKERTGESKNKSVEAEEYMKATRGSRDPIVDHIHKAAKRASRAPSGRPSESGSSDSKGSSKESQSNHTAITSGGANDVIRLRVDASAPLSLSFNGDMEGRTLQFTPAENGMADIVIGGARGGESTYRSEKGSVTSSSRKLLMANQARRDAEDASQQSSRSGRSRREGRESREIRNEWEEPRRILGRRRETQYH